MTLYDIVKWSKTDSRTFSWCSYTDSLEDILWCTTQSTRLATISSITMITMVSIWCSQHSPGLASVSGEPGVDGSTESTPARPNPSSPLFNTPQGHSDATCKSRWEIIWCSMLSAATMCMRKRINYGLGVWPWVARLDHGHRTGRSKVRYKARGQRTWGDWERR